jgi:sec-independent protein translocase protein TatA
VTGACAVTREFVRKRSEMGPVGLPEMAVIFVIALVLFGPKKLPELGRMLGTAISHFRRVRSEMKATFDRELQNLERQARPQKDRRRLSVR